MKKGTYTACYPLHDGHSDKEDPVGGKSQRMVTYNTEIYTSRVIWMYFVNLSKPRYIDRISYFVDTLSGMGKLVENLPQPTNIQDCSILRTKDR